VPTVELLCWRTSTRYSVTGPDGQYVGTYPTARKATDAAVFLIQTAYEASK
jgi:hypothetical protein